MAKAAEGCGGAESLEAELTCPICLCLYQQPVSLSCGHNFCRQCIEEALGSQQDPQAASACPVCRAHLGPTAELHHNFTVGNIVQAFQATASKGRQAPRASLEQEEGAEQGEETGVVLCEQCLDGRQPALKTCLVCEVSLCQAHLNKHNAKSFLQEHVLVDVGAGQAEERRCRDHGKPLECYCTREEECICMLCIVARTHKGHEVITLKEGHEKQLVKLSNTMTELQESKSDLVTALEELQESENKVKINTKKLTSELKELFNDIESELQEKKMMILSYIVSAEEIKLALIADMRRKMEGKRDKAEQNLQALQKIKEQPDLLLFFRDLKLVTDRIASLDLFTAGVKVEEVELDQTVITRCKSQERNFMSQLDSLLQDLRGKLDKQERIFRWPQSTGRLNVGPRLRKDQKKRDQM